MINLTLFRKGPLRNAYASVIKRVAIRALQRIFNVQQLSKKNPGYVLHHCH